MRRQYSSGLSYYPDGMSGRELDSIEIEVQCPVCKLEWVEEIMRGWGYPPEVETQCEECGEEFTAYVTRDF